MKIPKPTYEYRAVLGRVIDGDTVYLTVDLGFRVFASIEFRLARVNAPEMRGFDRERGHAAARFLDGLLDAREILVRSDKSRDKYGRWIGDLFVLDEGEPLSVSDALIAAGHAEAYMAR